MSKKKLYVNGTDKKPRKIIDFILALRYDEDDEFFKPTYLNKKCTKLDFGEGFRTLEDIYKIVKTQYKSITYAKLSYLIYKTEQIACLYCDDTDLVTFYFTLSHYDVEFNSDPKCTKKGRGKFSRKDIDKLIKKYAKQQKKKKKRKNKVRETTKTD